MKIRYIQKNDIDDNFNKINKKVKQISNYSSLRKLGIVTGLAGLNCAMLLGSELKSVVTGIAATLIAMIANKAQELKEKDNIQSEKSSFLLKLGEIEQNGR